MTDRRTREDHCWHARGKTGEDIGRASPMLVQYGSPVISTHPEAQQRISNVKPICPQRFVSRFES
jgi:hypothetical protein